MFELIAVVSTNTSHLIPIDDPRGILCVAGILYTLFLLIMAWSGWIGWLISLGIGITGIFMCTPMDDTQYLTLINIGHKTIWVTKDNVMRGVYLDYTTIVENDPKIRFIRGKIDKKQADEILDNNEFYYKLHVDRNYSGKWYHPVIWWMAPVIALALSPYSWIIFLIVVTFGGAGRNS